jgi:hypothetical protein
MTVPGLWQRTGLIRCASVRKRAFDVGGAAALGWVLALAPPALGFVSEVNQAGQVRRWALNPPDPRVGETAVNRATGAIIYRLDSAGYSETNTAAELNAIRVAFDQWQAIPATRVRFEEGPIVSGTIDINSTNFINTLFWTRTPFVNGGRDNLTGVLALTYVASFSSGNVIVDADMVFNGAQFRWFTDYNDATTQAAFIEAIALHEIGHLLGLRHSPVGGATMLFVGDLGVNSQVGLSEDEIAAARALYGTDEALGQVGRVQGVIRIGGLPVFGAAVFAQDLQGNLLSGTVTRSDGTYDMSGLMAGELLLRSSPLDPAVAANYLIRGAEIAGSYRTASTDFLPSADHAVTLGAGKGVTVDMDLVSGNPLRIVRILRPTPSLATVSAANKPVAVQPAGQTMNLGVFATPPVDQPVQLSIPGDGLAVGTSEVLPGALAGLTLIAAPVTVARDATPGLRSFRLESGGRVAWAHGFLELLPPVPDVNFDGLDDQFQRSHWPRFTSPEAGPAADPDGDGFDNAWEYTTGSEPTDSQSAHFEVVSVEVSAEGARVRSQTAAGKRFQLMTRDTVPGAEWQAVGPAMLSTGDLSEFFDPGGTNAVRFYRVTLLPEM